MPGFIFKNYGTFTGPGGDFKYLDEEPTWYTDLPTDTAFKTANIGVALVSSPGQYAFFQGAGSNINNLTLGTSSGKVATLNIQSTQTTVAGDVTITGNETVTGNIITSGSETVARDLTVTGGITCAGRITSPTIVEIKADIQAVRAIAGKGFDIPHPIKEDYRLRYICLEGPEVGAYVRGTLKDSDTIVLPDYWKSLVYPESISVNLTPIGHYQELFVDKIEWGTRIKLKNTSGNSIHCYYTVFGERVTKDKLQPEYKGLTPMDYPGDNSEYALAGWDYATHKGELKTSGL